MRITKLTAKNVFGFDVFEVEPKGSLTTFEGDNGTGKTTGLGALQAIFQGGTSAKILRQGQTEGEIVMILEHDDDTFTVRRGITEKGIQPPTARSLKKGKLDIPVQTWLNQLIDPIALNPIKFASAGEKEIMERVLEIAPLTVTAEELTAALGKPIKESEAAGNGLDVIAGWRKIVFRQREDINRTAKEKRAYAKQLRETLPAGTSGSVAEELSAAEQRIGGITSELTTRADHAKSLYEANVAEIEAAQQAEKATLAKESEGLRLRLAEIDSLLREMVSEKDARMMKAKEAISRGLEAEKQKHAEELTALRASAATLREKAAQHERAQQTLKTIDDVEIAGDQKEAESKALTGAIEKLDALKVKMSAEIAIPGVTFADGAVFVDGRPWENVNTAEKWKRLFIPLAAMRGDVVFLDDLEKFGPTNWAEFKEAAAGSGLQFFATRVGPQQTLEVRSE